jgi:hypothetical protein
MNQYPLWRYLLLIVVITIGAIYALPNIYGDDPALQVSARRVAPVDQALADRIGAALDSAGVAIKRIDLQENRLLVRFNDLDSRAAARDVVIEAAGDRNYVVALNLASATPAWLKDLGGKPMYMGLDLRGWCAPF